MAIINLLPQTITSFNLFVNGIGLGGKVKSLTLPKISYKKETYQTGGTGGDMAYHMGLELMEFSAIVADYDPAVTAGVGLLTGERITVLARAATKNKNGIKIPYAARLKGEISSLDFGTWDTSKSAELHFTVDVDYFRLDVGEIRQIEIDIPNMIEYIGGVDRKELDRVAILKGLTPI